MRQRLTYSFYFVIFQCLITNLAVAENRHALSGSSFFEYRKNYTL